MRTIVRRIQQLEEKAANYQLAAPNWCEVLRERRRRRAEAEGVPHKEPEPDPTLYANGRRPTWAEVLRHARAKRIAAGQSRSAEATTAG